MKEARWQQDSEATSAADAADAAPGKRPIAAGHAPAPALLGLATPAASSLEAGDDLDDEVGDPFGLHLLEAGDDHDGDADADAEAGDDADELAEDDAGAEVGDDLEPEQGDGVDEASTALGSTIAEGESARGGYNAYNTGTIGKKIAYSGTRADLTKLTLNQILAKSNLPASNRDRIFAAGKYQIIPATLRAAMAKMKLGGGEIFDAKLQERIFREYLIGSRRAPIAAFLAGKGSIDDAVWECAREWASIETPKGRKVASGGISDGTMSYYGGANSAKKGSGAKVRAGLERLRAAIAGAKNGGTVSDADRLETTVGDLDRTKTVTPTEKKPTTTALTGSVGKGGANAPDDVGKVQQRLADVNVSPGAIDKKVGPLTIAAIKKVQAAAGLKRPDGLIEPGKRTEHALFDADGLKAVVDVKASDEPQPTTETKTEKTETKPEKTETKTTEKEPVRKDGRFVVGGYPSSVAAGVHPRKPAQPEYSGAIVKQSVPGLPLKDSTVELTPAIVRAATFVGKYAVKGMTISSGVRTDAAQAAIIIRLAGGLRDNDLYQTWLHAVNVKKAQVDWVGISKHRSGRAFDLGGSGGQVSVGTRDAVVKKAAAAHPEAGIVGTVPEGGQSCLHVNING